MNGMCSYDFAHPFWSGGDNFVYDHCPDAFREEQLRLMKARGDAMRKQAELNGGESAGSPVSQMGASHKKKPTSRVKAHGSSTPSAQATSTGRLQSALILPPQRSLS